MLAGERLEEPFPGEEGTEISVVIPVYNGAETVTGVVDSVARALENRTFEILLVDDGSSDRSWDVLCALSDRAYVRSIRLLKNYGQHAAVVAGLSVARGEWIATIDDDGENDPSWIPDLMESAVAGGHDLIFAERQHRRAPLGRRLASVLVNNIVRRVFHAPKNLNISNYRLMRNEVARRIVADRTQYPYVNGLALEYSGSPASLLVPHGERQIKGSRYTLRSLCRLLTHILFSYSIWAYRMVVGFSIIAIAGSGGFSIVVLIRAALSETSAPGWASSVLLFSIMSIANLIALTVIGEYVVRALRQSRGPATFIVAAEK